MLASAERMNELHGLSCNATCSEGCRSCHFSFVLEFMAKTHSPAQQDSVFDGFGVPFFSDFVGGDEEYMILWLVWVLR